MDVRRAGAYRQLRVGPIAASQRETRTIRYLARTHGSWVYGAAAAREVTEAP